jgi:serine/threonine-protein kinase
MQPLELDSGVVPEIGKYHLVAELARGGMGIVHLACAQGPGGFNKLLVIKELKPELSGDETYVSMFLDEARLAARLTHPNIVSTIEVASEGNRHYMVMEFLDGRSLNGVVRHLKGGFPLAAHLRVLSEMLLGLHHAHELADLGGQPLGIVHRDVSPLNVFVTFDGQTKVLDFGIAKSADSTLETKTGVLKGRVAYMAPEQAWGARVDRRADVYSAGVMIWEAVARRRLWTGLSEVQILSRLLREPAPLLRTLRPDCSPRLEAICARALEKKPEDRYATALDLFDDLEDHLAQQANSMSIREVGALVRQGFADERRRMSALVEETLVRVRSGPRSGVMPRLEIRTHGTPSGYDGTSAALPRRGQDLETSQVSTSREGPTPLREAPSSTSPPASSMGAPPLPVAHPRARWSSRWAASIAVGAAALPLFLLLAVRGQPAATALPAAAPVAAPVAAPQGGLPAVTDSVELVVHVSPPGAQVAIDGVPAPQAPFHVRYEKDSLVHHVAAAADGYESKTVEVTFVNDTSVDLSLERHPSPPARTYVPLAGHAARHSAAPPPSAVAADPAPPASSSPPARVDITPSGGHAPLRPILTRDPYGGS